MQAVDADVVVVGAGAAGFFAAIAAAESGAQVLLLEKTQKPLAKVLVSGGGRCNVTHACYQPQQLVHHYPRGGRELLGPFHHFGPTETVAWFKQQGVALKTEADGRMFPTTDSSETIAQALRQAARHAGVQLRLGWPVDAVERLEAGHFCLKGKAGQLTARKVIVAAGGHPQAQAYAWLEKLGLQVVPPVPSLFTFNLPAEKGLHQLAGISLPMAQVQLPQLGAVQQGPVLITHWGLSGPAVLRLSAHMARPLAAVGYASQVVLQWLPQPPQALLPALQQQRDAGTHIELLAREETRQLPRRLRDYLWQRAAMHQASRPPSNKQLQALAHTLCADAYAMQGKTTFKEEFVTSGGVALSQINFKTMEAKPVPGLHLCGEVLDIDAVTGGFNFQAAWTTGWLAGRAAGL